MALRHLLLMITWLTSFSPAVDPDYPGIFGSDYDFAVKTIEENPWWSDSLNSHGIDPCFALSIVFPELIRYSSISDYIETKALEVLYVQYGRDYADFSIGLFQMKPSFAEQIETDLLKHNLPVKYPYLSRLYPSVNDEVETRKARVIRLKEEKYQLLYLEAFLRVMDTLNDDRHYPSPEEKLRFYAAAYNTGYFKDEEVIRDEMTKNRFYTGMAVGGERYSYMDIAAEYYLNKIVR
jgi:hypothetical protein